jgi:hypothetical protein
VFGGRDLVVARKVEGDFARSMVPVSTLPFLQIWRRESEHNNL